MRASSVAELVKMDLMVKEYISTSGLESSSN